VHAEVECPESISPSIARVKLFLFLVRYLLYYARREIAEKRTDHGGRISLTNRKGSIIT
jgi:hypothetical protein